MDTAPTDLPHLSSADRPAARADDPYRAIAIHLLSNHLGAKGYNESNPGVGVRFGLGNSDWYGAFGNYKNSISRDSTYVGAGKTLAKMGPVSLNLNGGLVTGYGDSPVAPFLSPEIEMQIGRARAMLNYFPKVKVGDMKSEHAIGLSLGVPF